MLSLAPWVVPLGIIFVSLFFGFVVLVLDHKLEKRTSNATVFLVFFAFCVILVALGSLLTMWIM